MPSSNLFSFSYFKDSNTGVYICDYYDLCTVKTCKELACYYSTLSKSKDTIYFYGGGDDKNTESIAKSLIYFLNLMGLKLAVSVVDFQDCKQRVEKVICISKARDILEIEAAAILVRELKSQDITNCDGLKIEDLFKSEYFVPYLTNPLLQKVFLNWKDFHAGVTEDQKSQLKYNFNDSFRHGGLIDWLEAGIISP